jgi:hypothetical protein
MSNIWTYRDEVSSVLDDVVGYDVEAVDGHIGKVDEASVEIDDAHLVVDTGFWIFGKKRVIPAGVVARIDVQEQRLYLTMTKDQVKDAPDWKDRWALDASARDQYSEYYGSYGMR